MYALGLLEFMAVCTAEFQTSQSYSLGLCSLLRKLDETSDSREFCYRFEVDRLKKMKTRGGETMASQLNLLFVRYVQFNRIVHSKLSILWPVSRRLVKGNEDSACEIADNHNRICILDFGFLSCRYIYSVEYGRVVDTKAGHDDASKSLLLVSN